jgi:hypothetical protein
VEKTIQSQKAEEDEREKRARRNREKKLKRKEREKRKKVGTGVGSGGSVAGSAVEGKGDVEIISAAATSKPMSIPTKSAPAVTTVEQTPGTPTTSIAQPNQSTIASTRSTGTGSLTQANMRMAEDTIQATTAKRLPPTARR